MDAEFIMAFVRNTKQYSMPDGRYCIKCRRGLWLVDAPSELGAFREGLNYFRQYYADGEYDTAVQEP